MTEDGKRAIRLATDAAVKLQQKAETVVGMGEEFSRELGMAMLTPRANPKSPLMQRLNKMKALTQECADEMVDVLDLLPDLNKMKEAE